MEALKKASADTRSTTLTGFMFALKDWRDRGAVEDAEDQQKERSTREEKPLRYDPYRGTAPSDATSSASPGLPSSKPQSFSKEAEEREWEREYEAQRGRDREERGGKGGIAGSLMLPGALSLLALEQGLKKEDDSDSVRDLPRRFLVGIGC